MSYDIYLQKENENVIVERFQEGGTRPLGGTDEAELNVTYNYQEVFHLYDWSIRDLHGKKAGETLKILEYLASQLPRRPYSDYWAPTPGNAGVVIHRLLAWAKQHPEAVWLVSS